MGEATRRQALAIGAGALAAATAGRALATAPIRPNIIHIVLDDARTDDFERMPYLQSLILQQGLCYTSHYTPIPVCAPSRIGMFTGLQPHNHGILTNKAWAQYVAYGFEGTSILKMLQDGGYYVGFVGKYINDYPVGAPPPTGANFYAAIQGNFERYYGFRLIENSGRHIYKTYITDVLAQRNLDFLSLAVPSGRPFALYFHPNAIHGPATPAEQDLNDFDPAAMPILSSFNVNIIKGPQHPPFTDKIILEDQTMWANRNDTAQDVDRAIKSIVESLPPDVLANTYFFVTSDNGLQLGEHRIKDAKVKPYVESSRVPLYVRGPGVQNDAIMAPVCNLDIYATIVEIAGLDPGGRIMDGQSLVPTFGGDVSNRTSMQPVYFQAGWAGATQDYMYVERDPGGVEFYDLKNDPQQLVNVAGQAAYAEAQAECAADLQTLKSCEGSFCKITHDYPPPPTH